MDWNQPHTEVQVWSSLYLFKKTEKHHHALACLMPVHNLLINFLQPQSEYHDWTDEMCGAVGKCIVLYYARS